ncbi:hypothetical protein [Priestia megaterium]|uniref:hypothetical protein n=1 Tax=Priestia megaterium TaxID=1404 RepID=UPI001374BF40|nr:hypothetical protein [Priestia megaterium]
MFNSPNCTVVSSFTKGDKMYITLELDLGGPTLVPERSSIELGDFKLDAEVSDGNTKLKLYYGNKQIAEWSIPKPEGCVSLPEVKFELFKVKDIEICLEGTQVCLSAGVYIKNPFTGDYNKLDDIHVCS